MDGTNETSVEALEDGPLTPRRLAAFFGATDVAIFAFVGHVTFGDPFVGALAGLLVGLGVFLFLPLFMLAESRGGLGAMEPAGTGHPLRTVHRLAAGLALSGAGIALIASQFAELGLLVGAGVAVVAAVALYVPLALALPNATL